MQLIFATRPSPLARWQTAHVIRLLQAAHPGQNCSEIMIAADSDHALEEALLSGEAHAGVYALEDLPVETTPGVVIAAIPERESAHDVLVSAAGQTLSHLPEGARVGTSSLRQTAQLLARRPDLKISLMRGDDVARVQKARAGESDAIVVAQAALTRLGLQQYISEVFSLDVMLPAPGQGALAVQCRANDEKTLRLFHAIHDPAIAAAVAAERNFLASLGIDYSLPVAAYAEHNTGVLILTGAVFSIDGKHSIRLSAVDTDPHRLGERLAEFVLERGAAELFSADMTQMGTLYR